MKCGIFLGSLSLLLVAPHEAAPVLKKVVSMLQGMKESSEKEKHEEEVQYASFSSWCEAELATKTRELGEAGDAAALLLAAGEDSEAKIAAGKAKLAELVKDLEKWEVEKENATLKRTKEASLYKETHQDYTESIQAILKASRSLKTSPSQGVSLLTKLPPHAAQKVAAFLAVYHSNLAPELDSLDFSSDRIEEMLNELRDRFSDERSKLEKEEMTLHHAHQSLMQELSTLISQAEAQQAELKQRKATEEKALGSSKSQLADAEASKKEMESYLSEVNQSCTQKAKDYKERQKLREGELSAIEKTIDLLSSQEIDRTQGRLSLTQRATALVSLSWPRSVSAAQSRAAEYLQNQAMKINSRVLFSMATRLSSASGTGADPMANVRKMLNNLITTLESESSEEMEHRDWCEKEMTANEKARDTRSSTVERLQTEMDSAEAQTAQLGAEITELQVQLSENAESVSNQTDARKLEKAENEKMVEDAKSATEAVAKAIEVLKNFYAGVAFIQSRTVKLAKAPEIFEGAYSPQGGDGVIAMLEVVQSDYSKLETTTAAQEVAAEKTFESLKSEMALLKVQQEKDLEHKKIQKGEKEQLIVGKKADLQNADKELTAALEYYEQLKDSCLATGSTAQERAARRAEEIQSLKEAMDLLEKGTQ